MESINIDIILVNTFFDFNEYSNPVKTYMDDRYAFDLLPGYVKKSQVYVQ